MVRRSLLRCGAVASALVVGAGVAACGSEDETWRCAAARCELTVSGSPTLEVFDARLKADVGQDRVRVAGGGVDITLNPGDAAVVDGLVVELRGVDGGVARLVLSPVDDRFARLDGG
ncbi:hypothetical protein [Actinokineospora terrae]|uniref:Lipoprotein n=1 Tax=Actinokineospora terrae TaxID=155974 RepID=A0A1H9PEY2_9PSEU|nr:hypothetical protein [Actinokineospora terrae]SER46836.1 hypothetical protein SAMN04487818_103427 [Actinokineospora terrae]